jgi:hypothetical protein
LPSDADILENAWVQLLKHFAKDSQLPAIDLADAKKPGISRLPHHNTFYKMITPPGA